MSNILIVGEKGIGKTTLVNEMVKKEVCLHKTGCGVCDRCQTYLNGNHPDVHRISGGKMDEVKDILYAVSEVPYYEKHIVIFEDMHDMAPAVQNTLLKPTEESNDRVMFILVSRSLSKIIPTIRSRMVVKNILPKSPGEVVKILKEHIENETLIKKAARFGQGNIGSSLEYISKNEFYEMLSEDLRQIKEKNFFEISQRYSKDYKEDLDLILEYYQKYLYEMIKRKPDEKHYLNAFEMVIEFKEKLIQNVNAAMNLQNIILEIQKA